jgi:hypothetical protein
VGGLENNTKRLKILQKSIDFKSNIVSDKLLSLLIFKLKIIARVNESIQFTAFFLPAEIFQKTEAHARGRQDSE